MRRPRRVHFLLLSSLLAGMWVVTAAKTARAAASQPAAPPVTVLQIFVPIASTPPAPPGAYPQPEDPALAAQLAPARVAARAYAAGDFGVPGTALVAWGGEVLEFPTLERKAFYQTFSAPLLPGTDMAYVTVDMATLERVDWGALRRAEAEAYLAQYGKMDISLWEWLQTAAPTATMAVGVWVVQTPPNDAMTLAEERTADIYPEMRALMDTGGHCWDISDMLLREMICATYRQFLKEETAIAVQPVVDWLAARGVVVDVIEDLPSVFANLTPALIHEIEKLEVVAWLFRGDAVAEPAWAGAP